MTTLLSWLSVDARRPAALYIASDSRISWTANGAVVGEWSLGRKVFASRTAPEVFGFAGDVVFPAVLLGQLVDLIDAGVMLREGAGSGEKADAIGAALRAALSAYPGGQRAAVTIFYGTRSGARVGSPAGGAPFAFHLFVFRWSPSHDWTRVEVTLPRQSAIIASDGSGHEALNAAVLRWNQSDVRGTSRALFSAFCDALEAGRDPRTGGAPQLVRLYPSGPARPIGVIWQGAKYLLGHPVELPSAQVEWRNPLFEVCDPISMLRAADSQAQPRPFRALVRGIPE